MMKSIKQRLVGSYVIVIIITVLLFELILNFTIRQYYLDNIEQTLSNQAQVFSKFFKQEQSKESFIVQASETLRFLSSITKAEIQIISKENTTISDTFSNIQPKERAVDVADAFLNKLSVWKGTMKETHEPIMAVSAPITSNGEVVGVVRLVTSLLEVYAIINYATWLFIAIGVLIVIIAILVSLVLSRTITKPVKEITIVARKMADGNFTKRVPKKRDDEIGHLADTLNFMANKILQQDKLKSEFIASVSHELRTPLTSILGWIITLRMGVWQDKERLFEGLEIIEGESKRLTSLVEQLLDFSQYASEKVSLQYTTFATQDWLSLIYRQMLPRAKRQGLTLLLEMGDLPDMEADENRLKQVLLNLLDNAIKFTPEKGTVTIAADMNQEYLQIQVCDTGQGISEEELPLIKQTFYKGNHILSGTGLGLAICNEITQLHGGEMKIESTVGVGTSVTLSIPLHRTRL